MFRVEVELVDYVRGTSRVDRLPTRYKTHAAALRAATRVSWICRPDGQTATQENVARIIPA